MGELLHWAVEESNWQPVKYILTLVSHNSLYIICGDLAEGINVEEALFEFSAQFKEVKLMFTYCKDHSENTFFLPEEGNLTF